MSVYVIIKGGPHRRLLYLCMLLSKEDLTVCRVYVWYSCPVLTCLSGIYVYNVREWNIGSEDLL
jgi:hypothetical protein